MSQFRQLGKQDGDQDRPHAGDGAQQFGFGLPDRVALQQRGNVLVQLGHLVAQQGQVVVNLGSHQFRRRLPLPVALLGLHDDQLTASGHQGLQLSLLNVGPGTHRRGLTTTMGSPAALNSAASRVSNPPVASTMIQAGCMGTSSAVNSASAVSV